MGVDLGLKDFAVTCDGEHLPTDFLHRTSTRLVRDYDVIVIEDLAVKN